MKRLIMIGILMLLIVFILSTLGIFINHGEIIKKKTQYVVKTHSWGIGFNTSLINDTKNKSGRCQFAYGGTGYSNGIAIYKSKVMTKHYITFEDGTRLTYKGGN